ncbi:alpha-glucan family phosphorylase [Nitrospira lenta]|uniref:Similar to glycogen phosphorylase n=1 Tax=Nitrospira lenta TaxID=1436998 RepID=A0A330L8S6_9BACT|nr:alpha-glucan family phosphorylase [Nitrospira lenta]SPP66340.1 Similar to glycogen phosphorylase [Nitrospira lenta]
MNTVKDPVCGMMLPIGEGLSVVSQGQEFRFCSELCQRTFLARPERYAVASAGVALGATDVSRRIVYFSMEVATDEGMPTYSGGLGVLAGDTLRSCADLKIPIVAVSLLYRRGYFEQHLDEWGNQHEQPVQWDPSKLARLLPATVRVSIEGRPVVVQAWQYDITGLTGYVIPLLLLDTNVEENAAGDRDLTSDLYGGDERYRLAQEVVLGIGGVRMLRALGYTHIERFHMNEGHAAVLALELLGERKQGEQAAWDFDGVRRACIFTTHTPVPAGHDQFSYELVKQMLGDTTPLEVLQMLGGRDRLNMTLLALNMSTYVNGVAKRHGEVSQDMFPGYAIDSITNGVHSATWTAPSFQQLYDRHIPGWRTDPFALRHAISIPTQEIWAAHVDAKRRLLGEVRKRTPVPFRDDALTIGFARRATQYKRAELVFSEPSQLIDMARTVGPIQFMFAGKAHPKDESGKEIIRRIIRIAEQLKLEIPIVYLVDYDLDLAKLLTSGVDLWLNTPLRPLEASGTSGMKAAHNGVPSLSVLDGWWVEGYVEGVTGWSIGRGASDAPSREGSGAQDARELYDKLRGVIAPLFYQDRARWSEIMRSTIAFNASFFNTHRMVQQYTANAYV